MGRQVLAALVWVKWKAHAVIVAGRDDPFINVLIFRNHASCRVLGLGFSCPFLDSNVPRTNSAVDMRGVRAMAKLSTLNHDEAQHVA